MKLIFRTLMLIGCLMIFVGCSDRNPAKAPEVSTDSKLTLKQIVEDIQKQQITEINIFKSERHGFIGNQLLRTLSNDEEFSVIVQSLSTASQQFGRADTVVPDYDVVISLNNDTSVSFHYWIDEEAGQGMLANVTDTGITYTLSPNLIQDLVF